MDGPRSASRPSNPILTPASALAPKPSHDSLSPKEDRPSLFAPLAGSIHASPTTTLYAGSPSTTEPDPGSPQAKAARAAARTHTVARLARFETDLQTAGLSPDSQLFRCARELREFMMAVDAAFAASTAYDASSGWMASTGALKTRTTAQAAMTAKAASIGLWLMGTEGSSLLPRMMQTKGALGAILLELAALNLAQLQVIITFLLEITGLQIPADENVAGAPTFLDGFRHGSALSRLVEGCRAVRDLCPTRTDGWTALAVAAFNAFPESTPHQHHPSVHFVTSLARNILSAYPIVCTPMSSCEAPPPLDAKVEVLLFLVALLQTVFDATLMHGDIASPNETRHSIFAILTTFLKIMNASAEEVEVLRVEHVILLVDHTRKEFAEHLAQALQQPTATRETAAADEAFRDVPEPDTPPQAPAEPAEELSAEDRLAAEHAKLAAERAAISALRHSIEDRLAALERMHAEFDARVQTAVAEKVEAEIAARLSVSGVDSRASLSHLSSHRSLDQLLTPPAFPLPASSPASTAPTAVVAAGARVDAVVTAPPRTFFGLSLDQVRRRGVTGLLAAGATAVVAVGAGVTVAPIALAAGAAGIGGRHLYARQKEARRLAADASTTIGTANIS